MSETEKPKAATPGKPRKRAAKAADSKRPAASTAGESADQREPSKAASANKRQPASRREKTSPSVVAPDVARHATEVRHQSAVRVERKAAATDTPAMAAHSPAMTPTKPTAGLATDLRQGDLIRVPMPVRWRDLDAFNHVNNSKYLSYLEEARLQWMLGVPGQGMDDQVAPVVAAAQLNYRRPITWPAQVVIELFVERLGNSSLTVGHRIVDAQVADVLFCDGHVVLVWIDRESGRSARLPESVREACADA